LFGGLLAVVAIVAAAATAAAAARAVFAGVARTFAGGRYFRRRGDVLTVLLLVQLRKKGKGEEGSRN
jgi:hypothetical protein